VASVTLVARLALALVFAVAGAGKLANLTATRDTIIAFGVPTRVARRSATLLPIAELLASLGLLVQQSSRWGAVLAAALLGLFIAGIGRALKQGRTPECNCFGQLSAAQIGPWTLARNASLLAVSFVIIWKAPGSSLTAWTSDLAVANLLAGLALLAAVLLGVSALHLRRAAASAFEADPLAAGPASAGLLPGDVAPVFALPDHTGTEITLDTLRGRGLPLVLVFASPACLPCRALIPELVRWQGAMGDSITFAVVESGVSDLSEFAAYRETGLTTLFEPERDLALAYSVGATPTAVVVGPDGRVATPPAGGGGAIEALVRELLRTAAAPLAPIA
jgi:uncharacterized membrane protein YphA (DoxX/SURF4 family)/peroxiredoxin